MIFGFVVVKYFYLNCFYWCAGFVRGIPVHFFQVIPVPAGRQWAPLGHPGSLLWPGMGQAGSRRVCLDPVEAYNLIFGLYIEFCRMEVNLVF